MLSRQSVYDWEALQEALHTSLPIIQQLFPMDVMFAFADTKKFLNYYPGKKLNIDLNKRQSIPPQSGVRWVIDH